MVIVLKCPMCGAPVENGARKCEYCNSTLLLTSAIYLTRPNNQLTVNEAVRKWKEAVGKNPNDGEAHYNLGLAYLNLQLRDNAIGELRKAAALLPEEPVIHYNLALALMNDGEVRTGSIEYGEALKAIEHAVYLDPNFTEAIAFKHLFIAKQLEESDLTEAIKEYKLSIDTFPNIALAHNNMGWCLAKAGKANYQKAIEYTMTSIQIAPSFLLGYSNLVYYHTRLEAPDKAFDFAKKAVELITPAAPVDDIVQAYSDLAQCLITKGESEEALIYLKKALEVKPWDADIRLAINNLSRPQKSGSGSGCFIATAVYGSYNCSEVILLRQFRDGFLLRSFLGSKFVQLYYFISPPVAKWLTKHTGIAGIVRFFLDIFITKLQRRKPYRWTIYN